MLVDILQRAGIREPLAGRLVAVVAPAVAAIERERGTTIETELLLAMLVAAAVARFKPWADIAE